MAKIFLCHANEDKLKVREVYQRLKAEGFEPWLDKEDLLPGQLWEQEIPRALKASDFILIFFSQNSVKKRGYVQRELKLALDTWSDIPEGVIHTIPIRLEDCELPEPFGKYHCADLSDAQSFEKIVKSIHVGLSQRQQLERGTLAGSSWTKEMHNVIGMEFVLIPAGEFLMGSNSGDDIERPIHRVQLNRPFYLSKYAVTQTQWQAVMENNPSHFKGDPNLPVENVSWEEVQAFIQRLCTQEGGTQYRLPTEAEWEYAARAGSTTAYCFGDSVEQLEEYAWYLENSEGKTHPVG